MLSFELLCNYSCPRDSFLTPSCVGSPTSNPGTLQLSPGTQNWPVGTVKGYRSKSVQRSFPVCSWSRQGCERTGQVTVYESASKFLRPYSEEIQIPYSPIGFSNVKASFGKFLASAISCTDPGTGKVALRRTIICGTPRSIGLCSLSFTIYKLDRRPRKSGRVHL